MSAKNVALYVFSIILILLIVSIMIYQSIAYGNLHRKYPNDTIIANSFYMILGPMLIFIVLSIIYIGMMGYFNYKYDESLTKYYRIYSIVYLVVIIGSALLSVIAFLNSQKSENKKGDNADFLAVSSSTIAAILAYIVVIILLILMIYFTRNHKDDATSTAATNPFGALFGGAATAPSAAPAASSAPAAPASAPAAAAPAAVAAPGAPVAPAAAGGTVIPPPKGGLAKPVRNFNPKDKKTQRTPKTKTIQNIAGVPVNYDQLNTAENP